MADTKDPMDKYLEQVDKGKQATTLSGIRKEIPSTPIMRPWFGAPAPTPKPPSKAPSGMGTQVKGDIGMYRQQEAGKVFSRRSLGGRDISNPLSYGKPETAIDPKFGPGDKVC